MAERTDPWAMSPEELLHALLAARAALATQFDRTMTLGIEVSTLRDERDALKARLEAQEKRAEEALARVKHMEWMQKGSPMRGERASQVDDEEWRNK